jgi:hypothetical protein
MNTDTLPRPIDPSAYELQPWRVMHSELRAEARRLTNAVYLELCALEALTDNVASAAEDSPKDSHRARKSAAEWQAIAADLRRWAGILDASAAQMQGYAHAWATVEDNTPGSLAITDEAAE